MNNAGAVQPAPPAPQVAAAADPTPIGPKPKPKTRSTQTGGSLQGTEIRADGAIILHNLATPNSEPRGFQQTTNEMSELMKWVQNEIRAADSDSCDAGKGKGDKGAAQDVDCSPNSHRVAGKQETSNATPKATPNNMVNMVDVGTTSVEGGGDWSNSKGKGKGGKGAAHDADPSPNSRHVAFKEERFAARQAKEAQQRVDVVEEAKPPGLVDTPKATPNATPNNMVKMVDVGTPSVKGPLSLDEESTPLEQVDIALSSPSRADHDNECRGETHALGTDGGEEVGTGGGKASANNMVAMVGAGIDGSSSCDSNASEISGGWFNVVVKTPESPEDAKPAEDVEATASSESKPSTVSSS